MKRYIVFPYFAGLAAVALLAVAFLIPTPSSAAFEPWPARYELGSADVYRSMTPYTVPEVAVARQDDADVSMRISARTTPVLHPDYVVSLKTDALNFVETRRRC